MAAEPLIAMAQQMSDLGRYPRLFGYASALVVFPVLYYALSVGIGWTLTAGPRGLSPMTVLDGIMAIPGDERVRMIVVLVLGALYFAGCEIRYYRKFKNTLRR